MKRKTLNIKYKKRGKYFIATFITFWFFLCSTDVTYQPERNRANVQELSATVAYLITSTGCPECVEVGMELLKTDGSAMDAALSVALSQIAAVAGSYVSYAGTMNMVYYEAKTGKVYSMNASWNTVKNEKKPMSIPSSTITMTHWDTAITNARTVLVPGFMKGVEASHSRFGKLPFEKLFDHAIDLAENGFIWTERHSRFFSFRKNVLTKFPETRAVFTKDDGSFYLPGDTFKQPELVKTLRNIVEEGADYMYTGKWAEKFVQVAQSKSSRITMKDLEAYNVIWSEPLIGTYKGYGIYTHGLPSTGGVKVIESMNIVEIANVAGMGHYSQSPEALSTLFKIEHAVTFLDYYMATKRKFPKLNTSPKSLLKKETARNIWKLINEEHLFDLAEETENNHSDAILATDKEGNMVAMVHTINTGLWGTNGLFVEGISISDAASSQQHAIRLAGRGKRLPAGLNPTIVMREGKPILGFAVIGFSGVSTQAVSNLINVLDFGMTPQEAVESPSLGSVLSVDGNVIQYIQKNKFSKSVIDSARLLGCTFVEGRVTGSWWSGIYCDPKTGKVQGTLVPENK
ncbi:gamma-glutamyltransferase [bacterium AH-315-C07]|nr:gamma-glutamyltransferase [bacterium AH-315-C07]